MPRFFAAGSAILRQRRETALRPAFPLYRQLQLAMAPKEQQFGYITLLCMKGGLPRKYSHRKGLKDQQ